MSAYLKIVSFAALLFLVPQFAAHAAPAKAAVPYRLVLSLGKYWNTSYTGFPKVTVTFVNPGPYTLTFVLPSPYPGFTIEYKAATADPASNTGWQKLESGLEPPPPVRKHGKVVETENHVIIAKVEPQKKDGPPAIGNEYDLVGHPMAAEGFYRITAVTKILSADELVGPADAQTEVRRFDLTLHSNSIVVRRTASGFTAVSPV